MGGNCITTGSSLYSDALQILLDSNILKDNKGELYLHPEFVSNVIASPKTSSVSDVLIESSKLFRRSSVIIKEPVFFECLTLVEESLSQFGIVDNDLLDMLQ